jgi:hypothetical protein
MNNKNEYLMRMMNCRDGYRDKRIVFTSEEDTARIANPSNMDRSIGQNRRHGS